MTISLENVEISGGVEFSWILTPSGKLLYSWGSNYLYQLGDGTTINKSSPVQIGSRSWIAIAKGSSHSLGISNDGKLFAWGANNEGQLGDNDPLPYPEQSPSQIGSSNWSAISAGLDVSFAIRSDGKLFAWGKAINGQLGDGTTINKSSPVQIGSSSWIAVSAGASHAVGLRSGGTLFTWGANGFGQLGDGTTIPRLSPVQIGSSSWTIISAGAYHTLGTLSNNDLYLWGRNNVGQLGDSTTVNKSSPVQISSSSWTALSAGRYYTLALKSNGTLFAWGSNNYGQLGDSTTVNKSSPVQVGDLNSWKTITAGQTFSSGVAEFNIAGNFFSILYTWGDNQFGQLGRGDTINKSSPVGVTGGGASDWSRSFAGCMAGSIAAFPYN